MHMLVIALTCLAATGRSYEDSHNSNNVAGTASSDLPLQQGDTQRPHKSFASLLLSLSPSSAWQTTGACRGCRQLHAFIKRADVSMKAAPASSVARKPQVIRLRDAVTEQEISIVGSMHYNPGSIACAKEEVVTAFRKNNNYLGAVVIESCKARFNKSMELMRGPFAGLLQSEMIGALAVAKENGAPTLLGDTDIEYLLSRLKQFLGQTTKDLLNPLTGGWQAVFTDLVRTLPGFLNTEDIKKSERLLDGEAPLSPFDVTPKLVVGTIRAFIAYPLSFLVKAPIPIIIFFAGLYAYDWLEAFIRTPEAQVEMLGDDAAQATAGVFEGLSGVDSVFTLLVTASFARLLMVPMLEERNSEIARSIRRAAAERKGPVVAVLGAAHVNGVARLLLSEETPDADGRNTSGTWAEVPPDMDWKPWTTREWL